jgi:hypothetical protein
MRCKEMSLASIVSYIETEIAAPDYMRIFVPK